MWSRSFIYCQASRDCLSTEPTEQISHCHGGKIDVSLRLDYYSS